jgi:hypothetical protein
VIGHQLVDLAVGAALSCEREEETLLGDGLVEDLVPEVGHQRGQLTAGPPRLVQPGEHGPVSEPHLVRQDDVLLGQRTPAACAVLPEGRLLYCARHSWVRRVCTRSGGHRPPTHSSTGS